MALIPVVIDELIDSHTTFSWTDMVVGDEGEPVEIYKFADRTMQCIGTVTNHLILQGTNILEVMPWYQLVISVSVMNWGMINPGRPPFTGSPYYFNPRYVRPVMIGTAGATDLPVTVTIFCIPAR